MLLPMKGPCSKTVGRLSADSCVAASLDEEEDERELREEPLLVKYLCPLRALVAMKMVSGISSLLLLYTSSKETRGSASSSSSGARIGTCKSSSSFITLYFYEITNGYFFTELGRIKVIMTTLWTIGVIC